MYSNIKIPVKTGNHYNADLESWLVFQLLCTMYAVCICLLRLYCWTYAQCCGRKTYRVRHIVHTVVEYAYMICIAYAHLYGARVYERCCTMKSIVHYINACMWYWTVWSSCMYAASKHTLYALVVERRSYVLLLAWARSNGMLSMSLENRVFLA